MSFFVWFFSISFATCFPFNVSSLPLYFLFLFILFPSVLFFFVSSCFLFSFTFSPFLNFLFFVFLWSLCSVCQTICGKNLFKLLRNYFFFFSPQKKLRFLCFLFSWVFFHVFPCLVFFCVLKKWFLVFITRLFFILLFNYVSLFSPFWLNPKIRMCFLSWNVGKLSFVFCFCSLGLKTFCVQKKNRFIFHYFLNFF